MQFGLRWFATTRVPNRKLRITSRARSSIGFSQGNDHDLFVSRMDAVASQRKYLQCYARPVASWLRPPLSLRIAVAGGIVEALGVAGTWAVPRRPDRRARKSLSGTKSKGASYHVSKYRPCRSGYLSFRVSDRRRSPAASCRDRGTCSSPHLRASSTYFALSASTYCASALPCASSNCATHDWLAATHIWVRAVKWSQVARPHSGGSNNTSVSHVDSRPRPS